MEFKEGDRVHVIQHNGRAVDFYATLREISKNFFLLTNCTDEKFKGDFIRKSEINCFGPNRTDYYTLATDEEDTEEPEVQHINDQFSFARSKNYELQEYIQVGNNLNIAKNMKEGCTMPTIKTKKEMNLPQLIEYGFNNPKKIKGKIFKPQSFDSFWNPVDVRFSDDGCAVNVNGSVTDEDVYTVEIEEEITEDMKLFLISRCIGKLGNVSYLYDRTTIKRRLKNLPEDCEITHFYIENENKELVLIWTKEKGLVE